MPILIKCSTCGELTALHYPVDPDIAMTIDISPCATCLDEYDELVRKVEELEAIEAAREGAEVTDV